MLIYLKEFNEWMVKYQINKHIKRLLESFDGDLLNEFNKMYKKSPHFFYSTLSQNGKVPLKDVLKFTNEFNKLPF
jgi:hypothetical protein